MLNCYYYLLPVVTFNYLFYMLYTELLFIYPLLLELQI